MLATNEIVQSVFCQIFFHILFFPKFWLSKAKKILSSIYSKINCDFVWITSKTINACRNLTFLVPPPKKNLYIFREGGGGVAVAK